MASTSRSTTTASAAPRRRAGRRRISTQTVEHGNNPVIAAHYTHAFGGATLFEVKGGGIYIRDNFTPFSDDFVTPQHFDSGTGLTSGNGATGQPPGAQPHDDRRVGGAQPRTTSSRVRTTSSSAYQTQYATQKTNTLTFSNVTYTDLNAQPYTATFKTPAVTGGRLRQNGAYAQDNWTLNDRLTLNLGVRFDHTVGDIPSLDSQTTLDRHRHRGAIARRPT